MMVVVESQVRCVCRSLLFILQRSRAVPLRKRVQRSERATFADPETSKSQPSGTASFVRSRPLLQHSPTSSEFAEMGLQSPRQENRRMGPHTWSVVYGSRVQGERCKLLRHHQELAKGVNIDDGRVTSIEPRVEHLQQPLNNTCMGTHPFSRMGLDRRVKGTSF